MITNIQLLRAFAALGVVIYHTDFRFRQGVHTEFQGVAIFFVISGFIMTYISRNDAKHFLLSRCIRIIPLYWLVTLLLFSWHLITLFPFHVFTYLANNEGAADGLTLANLLKSLLFIPYKNHVGDMHPLVRVGWTLNLEMYFYVLYAAALAISTRFAPIVVCIAILAINGLSRVCAADECGFYAHDYTYYFIFGVLVFYFWHAVAPPLENGKLNAYLAVAAGVVVASVFFLWNLSPELVSGFSGFGRAAIGYSLPSLVVAAALFMHSAGIQCNWKPMLILGDASYALYLIHTMLIGGLRRMGYAIDAQSGPGSLMVVIAVSCLAAVLVHYLVERPIAIRLRRRFTHDAPSPRLTRRGAR